MIHVGRYYKGTVVSQALTTGRNGEPVLSLEVNLKSILLDSRRPTGGSEEIPKPFTVETNLRFPADNEVVMTYGMRDLNALGFADGDLSRLAEDHPKHHSFVGNEVYVTPSEKTYNGQQSTFWNLRFPRERAQSKASSKDDTVMAAASAYRDLMERKKAEGMVPGSPEQFDFPEPDAEESKPAKKGAKPKFN